VTRQTKRPRAGQGAQPWALPLLLMALAAGPAWAQAGDTHAADPGAERLLTSTPSAIDAPTRTTSHGWSGPALLGTQFGAGAAAAVVTVPLTLWGASAVGSLSNDLLGAALPSLVMLLVLPPLAVTVTEFFVGQALGANPRLWSAFFVTLGTQVVAIAGGVLLGLWAGNPTHVALFTVGEAILLPSAATLMLGLSQHRAGPSLAGAGNPTTTMPPMVQVPLIQGDF